MPANWKRILTTGDNSNYKNSSIVASDLPKATASAVGGVKIGSGISVDGNGEISADAQTGTVQALSVSGQTLSLSNGGGSITLPDSDTQDLSISGRVVSLTNSPSVTIPASSSNDFTGTLKTKLDGIEASADDYGSWALNAGNTSSVSSGKAVTFTGTGGMTISQAVSSGNHTITFNSANTSHQTTFAIEDGDGTEVTMSHGKELKFVEGTGIDINFTDTTPGSDADPFDLTITNTLPCNEAQVKSVLSGLTEADTLTIGDSGNDCQVNINGNLTVNGLTTTVNSETVTIADNIIELNSDFIGSNASASAGITVNRGSTTGGDASLTWAENVDAWQLDYNTNKAFISVVNQSSSAPTGNDGSVQGKGAFWLDTTNHQMYVMLDG